MLALTGRVLNGKNDDLFGFIIDRIIHEIGVVPSYMLPHALDTLVPADIRKQNEALGIQGWQSLRVAPPEDFVRGCNRRWRQDRVPHGA